MNIIELITKKRNGQQLETAEIEWFVRGVSDGSWQDYQISAMLMAMFIRGLDNRETADLTVAMARSGSQLDLSPIPGFKVDKHSTGGVADTTSLILVPLVAACGVPVVKLSGRGLGFTGGTLDKLESIPGFKVRLPVGEALALVRRYQAVILSADRNLNPADKKLYALRDVTATVDSIPLIASSIMSKKIAAGADGIVLDVKCGSGAFMPDLANARQLAVTMVDIGRRAGRQVAAVISSMAQPLGLNVGNSLEVIEAIEVLKGRVTGDLLEVSLLLGSHMLRLAGKSADLAAARALLLERLQSGAGLARFRDMIAGQGGDPRVLDDYSLFPQPGCRAVLTARRGGYLAAMDTAAVGRAFVAAGGGRVAQDDPIDYAAGFCFRHRLGDPVRAGDALVDIQAAGPEKLRAALDLLEPALVIADRPPEAVPVVLDQIV